MLERIVRWSIRNPFLVFVAAFIVAGAGVLALRTLPIDAVPDVTNVQVQVLTTAPALGPLEVEQFVTFPVEAAMSGLPRIAEIRSVSRIGLSVVTVVFKDDVDIYFARQLVQQRLSAARENIPPGYGTPELGPISTGLGEIYQFEVLGEGRSAMELRGILDWQIAPRLRSVPGVTEVIAFGGQLKTYEIQVDPARLVSYGIALQELFDAVQANNANAGGGYLVRQQEQLLIRGEGLINSLEDLENVVVTTAPDGTPVYVKNIGRVAFSPMLRQGAVTRDGRGEVVTGIALMLIGENSRAVVNQVKKAVSSIQSSLPKGVRIEPFYDRSDLVRKTIRTVATNLLEGSLLVIVALFLMLRNLRGGIVVASIIPLSMLGAFIGMSAIGVSGNLMSLGAIDFGLIVDGAVIIVENSLRLIAERNVHLKRALTPDERKEVVTDASSELVRATAFGIAIITVVYLPILTLTGVEGKMFRPMALTVIFALVGALLLAVSFVPAFASLVLSLRVEEKESVLVRRARRLYEPALRFCLSHRPWVVGTAALLLAASLLSLRVLGSEFIPRLDEGALAIQAWRLPSVALEESVRQTTLIEQMLKRFPEVTTVVSRTGRAELATDPMGLEISDVLVMLKPHDQWTTTKDREELISKMDSALKHGLAGTVFSYSQPIELRVSEIISGVRSDVALKVYGQDLATLRSVGDRIVAVLQRVPGAADVKAEQIAGLPVARVAIDREKIARYGINARQVLDVIETIGGKPVGTVLEGQQRFAIQVRFEQAARKDVDQLSGLRVRGSSGQLIPLSQVATITVQEGPAQISRENIRRRLTVEMNVRGRDLAGFVRDAEATVAREVQLPSGYWLEWGGQFENLQAASARLAVVVPVALFLIFILLYTSFGAVRPALLIYLNIPFAVTGGLLALLVRGMPLSISAGVGFIALFGVAVLNGLVLVSHIRALRARGLSPANAAHDAAHARFRAVLTTALVAALGFVPMALATGAGAEVQKPLATVVIGGLITSTLLTLLVLPTVYTWFDPERQAAPSKVKDARSPVAEGA